MSNTNAAEAIANLMIDAVNGLANPLEILLLLTLFVITVGFCSAIFTGFTSILSAIVKNVSSKHAAQQRINRRF